MGFVLLLIGFAVFVFFLGKFLVVYASRWASAFVGRRMEDAEFILHTGLIPHRWLHGPWPVRTNRKRDALHRLDRLVKYYERTPFVENETVRRSLISRLDAVLDTWETSEWEQLLP